MKYVKYTTSLKPKLGNIDTIDLQLVKGSQIQYGIECSQASGVCGDANTDRVGEKVEAEVLEKEQ